MINWKKIFIGIGVIYSVLFLMSEQKANFFIAMLFVLFIPLVILRHIMRNFLYKNSIFIVPKSLRYDSNAISNNNCIIRYTPDSKIIVMDNISTDRKEIKIYTLLARDLDINYCWSNICRVFDEHINSDILRSIFERFDYKYNLDIVQNNNYVSPAAKATEESQESAEIAQTQETKITNSSKKQNIPDKHNDTKPLAAFEVERNKVSKQELIAGIKDTEHVDFSQLASNTQKKEIKSHGEQLADINNISAGQADKIDLNNANSETLSALPGINIIGAKKAVDYRNKNGQFSSVEEFFDVVGVKEFFKDKIRERVFISPNKTYQFDEMYNDVGGRIVDL